MQPREITARYIRAQLLNQLLIPFLFEASQQNEEWTNITVSRLIAVIGERKPHVWTTIIDTENAPAVIHAINLGRSVRLDCLLTDPASSTHRLECVALLHESGSTQQLMPDNDIELKPGDRILFCGKREAKDGMHWILQVMSSLNYVMTYENEPESYIWRILSRNYKGVERRSKPRRH